MLAASIGKGRGSLHFLLVRETGNFMLEGMIVIVSGTNRAGSNSLKLSLLVQEMYRGLGAETRLLDLAELPGELFAPTAYKVKPERFQPWADAVLESSGLVLVVPEYNGSFPGVLKLFIDMLPFPESFQDRPSAFIGLAAGRWGGLRAVEHMQQVFGYRNAYNFPVRVFLPDAYALFDGDGALVDPGITERLQTQASGFLRFIQGVAS